MVIPTNNADQSTQPIKVSIETLECTIVGVVHPPSMAYRGRLSDLLNQKYRFLNVTDATVYCPRNSDQPSYTTSYLAVNLDNIAIIRPIE